MHKLNHNALHNADRENESIYVEHLCKIEILCIKPSNQHGNADGLSRLPL